MVAREITLPVDPDEAWEALTDPDRLAEWLGEDREMAVEDAVPGERLSFWWWQEGEPGTRVEFRLAEVPGGTHLTVTETPTGPFALAAA
jgi:uncharacterized protein YndB with AHSA1/START domain